MTLDQLALLALTVVGLSLVLFGFMLGFMCANRFYRRHIPEHPTLRTGTTHQRQLRLVHGGRPPYDWQSESEGA